MAFEVSFAPAAEDDLDDILVFLSAESPGAARRIFEQFGRAAERLADHPFLGPAFLTAQQPDLRKLTIIPYLIIYRVLEARKKVQIVRVLHASRDLSDPELFEGSNEAE